MSASEPYQAGVRPTRTEWVVESTEGTTPDDPEWLLFSDNMTNLWSWEPDANTQRQDAVGEITAQGFFNGTETHEAEFEYDLQQWYIDGSSNRQDAGYDFLEPDSDNSLRATHSVVSREEHASGGTAGGGRRIYTVGKGGHPDTLTTPFENEDGSPISQTAAYQFEKIRQYSVSQPSSSTTVWVQSTSSNDTSQSVEIENEGAGTTESVSLNGTTAVESVSSFGDIDVVELSAETEGDVEVYDADPSGSANLLVTIKGQNAYPAGEGDLGIPALGSGSHASALGSSYIRFLGDSLSIPNIDGELEIISGEMTVETGLEDNPKTGTASRNIHAAQWTYTITATLAGEKVSVEQTTNYLTENTGTITWTADEGSIDFESAFIQSPGEVSKEAGNGKAQFDNEFEAETISVS